MIKLVRTMDFNFDEATSNHVKAHSRGFELNKTASDMSPGLKEKIAKLEPKEDHTYVHVLAVGDTEKTGPNKNNDGFRGKYNKTAHETFKSGCVFKDHKNNDPKLAVGHVPISHYNDSMGRIELVIGLDNKNEKNAVFLEDIENGRDIGVSMGCKVAFDVCSICGHEAPSPGHYCSHMKTAAGKVLDDGRQVYVDNPNPTYFDISVLSGRRPADRVAWSFSKVASENTWVSSVKLASLAGLKDPSEIGFNLSTLSVLRKLAEMEKEVEGVISSGSAKELEALLPETNGKTDKVMTIIINSGSDPKDITDHLAGSNGMLGLKDFLKMTFGDKFSEIEDVIPDIEGFLPGSFGRLLEKGDDCSIAESLRGGSSNNLPFTTKESLDSIDDMILMSEPVVRKRVTISLISPNGVSNIKKASVSSNSSTLEALAELYAQYKLASVAISGSNPIMMKAAVANNFLKKDV